MDSYNQKVCDERHERIEEKLTEHDVKLKEHDEKLDTLAIGEAVHTTQIENLCKEIHGLVATTKWFIGLIAGGIIGFFFYALEAKIF